MRLVASSLPRFVLCRLNSFPRRRPPTKQASNESLLPGAPPRFRGPRGSHAFYSTLTCSTAVAEQPKSSDVYACGPEQLRPSRSPPRPSPVGPSHKYGRWRSLFGDESRLSFEADVLKLSPEQPRLVDLRENINDFHLWLCILGYRRQRDGLLGVAEVMEGLVARGSLFSADTRAAQLFWRTILDYAPQDKGLMENVWAYAEWLHDNHDVQWPGLYTSIITSLVREERQEDALRWHMRLSPHFGLDSEEFTKLVMELVAEARHPKQAILQMLYLSSHHRRLYDAIIPHLYANGYSQLARSWRVLFLCHNDLPRSIASRPFLRFIAAYCPDEPLEVKEREIAGLTGDASEAPRNELSGKRRPPAQKLNLRELVNRAHGQTFGIAEKGYDDGLGAKYFASSWISLDFAINSIHLLGMTSVGPLTLQSIALREENTDKVKKRIQQLEAAHISVGESNYAQAIRQWASARNQKMLSSLIRSDMHPDIFEDVRSEGAALASAVATGNWNHFEVIAAVRLVAASHLITAVSNQLVQTYLEIDNKPATLRLLDMMSQASIDLLEPTVDVISSHIPQQVSPYPLASQFDASFYACLCSMMIHLHLPPSSTALRAVLLQLSRAGCFDEFQLLALEITDYYLLFRSSDRPMMRIHRSDVPIPTEEGEKSSFQLIPRDLSWRHPFHPLRLVFDASLQSHVIRRAFGSVNFADQTMPKKKLHFADGVRLLALLRDKWAPFQLIDHNLVRRVVVASLAQFARALRPLCPGPYSKYLTIKAKRRWRLRVAKDLIEKAWGRQLLPSVPDLEQEIFEIRQSQWASSETPPDARS